MMACAVAMGKTPIVVRDGPGFLVNRILTAYMVAFLELLRDGEDECLAAVGCDELNGEGKTPTVDTRRYGCGRITRQVPTAREGDERRRPGVGDHRATGPSLRRNGWRRQGRREQQVDVGEEGIQLPAPPVALFRSDEIPSIGDATDAYERSGASLEQPDGEIAGSVRHSCRGA